MRTLIKLIVWIVAWGALPAGAADEVPYARDLRQDGELAAARGAAVLVAFVGEGCGYCETLLHEFLIPMSRNPDYRAKVVMRRVEVGGQRSLRDFSGKPGEHGQFAERQGARFMPTVMIFDSRGRLLAKPLPGMRTRDYYGADLDELIDQALGRLRASEPARAGLSSP